MEPVTVRAAPQKVSFIVNVRIARGRLSRFPHGGAKTYGRWYGYGAKGDRHCRPAPGPCPSRSSGVDGARDAAFRHLHDDSIYFVGAKSMAEGSGYRILSLPAEPFQTKYPPLWSLALAAIWKIDPQ